MNEENKQPLEEEEQAPEAQAQEAQQPQAEAAAEGEKEEKNAKAKKKKEKGITFTREQVEQMELAAKQLESVKDQFVPSMTTTASAPPRKRKDCIRTPRRTRSGNSLPCMITWSGLRPARAERTRLTRRGWR